MMKQHTGRPRRAATGERILLTGATGYVGGRLLKALEAEGQWVRCLARRPEFLAPRVADSTQVVSGDVMDSIALGRAMQGVHTAYYLIHSMGTTEEFQEADRKAAKLFGDTARKAGVERLIYLGGLGGGERLSSHLESRQEVGRILASSGISTVEFRASIIIGSGSLSFEMIRALVEKLPVMVTPRWVRMRAQPIAIEDVIAYLLAALDQPQEGRHVFEIGGPDQVSYLDIMREYARQRGLKRWVIPVPVLTPRLSSLWLGLVTPIYARIGRMLIDSIRNDTLVTDESALEVYRVRPRGVRDSIERALVNEDQDFAETRWSDATSSIGRSRSWGGVKLGTRIVDSRVVTTPVQPAKAFEPIAKIGGHNGWYYGNWLWRLRGFLDLLVGGPGLRRGRRDPKALSPGDTLDFWRVERIEPNHLLRLSAEMKVPGRAWLQFEVDGKDEGSTIRQTAIFDPDGLLGLTYWYALYPLHNLVFRGMLNGISHASLSKRPSASQ
jgi:uncharacterized protein YbjT (DUF2867 family)